MTLIPCIVVRLRLSGYIVGAGPARDAPDFLESFRIGERPRTVQPFSFIDHANQLTRDLGRKVEGKLTHKIDLVWLGQGIVGPFYMSSQRLNESFRVGGRRRIKYHETNNALSFNGVFRSDGDGRSHARWTGERDQLFFNFCRVVFHAAANNSVVDPAQKIPIAIFIDHGAVTVDPKVRTTREVGVEIKLRVPQEPPRH